MSETSFASQMLAKYETLMLSSAGMRTINVDGVSVSVADLEAKHAYWAAQVAREDGTRPVAVNIDLRSF
jgi:hypothetical protein